MGAEMAPVGSLDSLEQLMDSTALYCLLVSILSTKLSNMYGHMAVSGSSPCETIADCECF